MIEPIIIGFVMFSFVRVYQIKPNHPRLYIDDLDAIRDFVTQNETTQLIRIKGYIQRRLNDPDGTIDTLTTGNYPHDIIILTAFTAIIDQDQYYVDLAKNWVDVVRQVHPDVTWDTGTRYRLYSMAIAYDWLYDHFSASEKIGLRDSMYAHLVRCEKYYNNPYYTGTHCKLGNMVSLSACLAVVGDDARFDPILDIIYYNHVGRNESIGDGYNPVMMFMGEGGAHQMGWNYGFAYARLESVLMWYRATVDQELWIHQYLHDFGYFMFYPIDRTEIVPLFGDNWFDLLPGGNPQMSSAMSSSLGGNKHAALFDSMFVGNYYEANQVVRLISRKDYVEPADSFNDLPLARVFNGSGRNTWEMEDEDAVILTFKSTPFRSVGHHHYDQNSFVINYRGGLLLDTGQYDGTNTDHYRNYYSRTIAHNTMVVYSPREPWWDLQNDGGQRYITNPWPKTIQDLTGYGKLNGIEKSAVTDDRFSWVRGDASLAYTSEKLKVYKRDILMAYSLTDWPLPVIFVVDRVEVTREELVPRILWHIPSPPEHLGERKVKIFGKSNDTYVRMEFLGDSQEMTIIDPSEQYKVDGVEFIPQFIYTKNIENQLAWGRLEISPTLRNVTNKTTFMTLITVGNTSLDDTAFPVAEKVFQKDGEYYGCKISDTLILAIVDQNVTKNIVLDKNKNAKKIQEIFVSGVEPDSCMRIFVDGRRYPLRSNEEGVARFPSEISSSCRSDVDLSALISGLFGGTAVLVLIIILCFVLLCGLLVMKKRGKQNEEL